LESGLKTDLEPDLSTVESLGAALTYNGDLRGLSVIRIQGDRSDETIAKIANAAGASVVLLTVYRTTYAVWEPHWIRKVIESPPDFITFTSGSTVEGFISILGRKQALAVCDKSRIAVLGPSTRAIAVKSGIRVDVEARTATPEGLIEAIIADVKKTKRKGG
jgi:uroporphyrinogen III methyltransferase/synthase